jgi:hypothetical protein
MKGDDRGIHVYAVMLIRVGMAADSVLRLKQRDIEAFLLAE